MESFEVCVFCGEIVDCKEMRTEQDVQEFYDHKEKCRKDYEKMKDEYDDRVEDVYWYGG